MFGGNGSVFVIWVSDPFMGRRPIARKGLPAIQHYAPREEMSRGVHGFRMTMWCFAHFFERVLRVL